MPHNERGMGHVVPFKVPETFAGAGIDWTRDAATERERALREAYLTHESSCGPEGLVSILLLSTVSRRQGAVAEDLQTSADFAEVLLGFKLRKHQDDTLAAANADINESGPLWL
jgi:hypothetical protein